MTFSLPTYLHILRNRNFSFYLSSKMLGTIAVQMQNVAIGWQVYHMTGNLFDLGLVGLAQFMPFFILILFAGHTADRHNRRTIILFCIGMQILCAGLLASFVLFKITQIWPILFVLTLFGCTRAFMMPASQAILINLVPKKIFGNAVAISSSGFHLAIIIGPILGGLLYLAGPLVVYGTVAMMAVLALICLLQTKASIQATNNSPATWHSVLEGLRFVWSRPIVLGAISLDLFAVLFGGATALLPAYAHDVLHMGPDALGLLRTAPGVGAAVTAILLALWPITRHVGWWMFGGVTLFGTATIILGLSANMWIAIVALLAMGMGDMVSVYIRHMLVQLETPDAIRGRVSAVNSVFIGASNELGEFESGITAAWFGLVPAIIFGGAATLIVTGLWSLGFPVLRKMDYFPHTDPVERKE